LALLDLKYALSSCAAQLLESGLGSKRANTDRALDPELKNREISFLTRILGRMTPTNVVGYASNPLNIDDSFE
jgi:hypothetical protein